MSNPKYEYVQNKQGEKIAITYKPGPDIPIAGESDDKAREATRTLREVMFFPNGNTAVFISDEQVPELQHPWLIKFVEFLDAQGHDPASFQYTLPDGKNAKVFRTESGWSWEI